MVFASDARVAELGEREREDRLKQVYLAAHNAALAALFDHSYFARPPLFVAAACIAFGRTFAAALPAWPEELEQLTGLRWVEFEEVYHGLVAAHPLNVPEAAPGKLRPPRAAAQADENAQPEGEYLGKRVTIRELRNSFLASRPAPGASLRLLHNR